MIFEVTCRGCGQAYEPAHADYVAGRWVFCPACRAREHDDPRPASAETGDRRTSAASKEDVRTVIVPEHLSGRNG